MGMCSTRYRVSLGIDEMGVDYCEVKYMEFCIILSYNTSCAWERVISRYNQFMLAIVYVYFQGAFRQTAQKKSVCRVTTLLPLRADVPWRLLSRLMDLFSKRATSIERLREVRLVLSLL